MILGSPTEEDETGMYIACILLISFPLDGERSG
jgi:hypothetical protein